MSFDRHGEALPAARIEPYIDEKLIRFIMRFFALPGIGVAVISYRLLHNNNWKSQIIDAAKALNWVHLHIQEYKGNPNKTFIGGHFFELNSHSE